MARGRSQRQKRPSRSERHRRRQPARRPVSELTVRLPERRVEPETVIAHLGPTNSGKTHDALRFLVEHGEGVYAAPLRMLAQEAHRRLAAELGDERVGLVTGEERVNPGAPIVCCTAEMAPLAGETLVLDEVQWAEDEERGSAWTRLLLGGEYRHVLLLGAVEALPLVRHAFPQAEIRFFERKAPLDWAGRRAVTGLGPGTVVVAFSRRAVIGLAGELNQLHPGRVACLYGAMPLASRREEIDRFADGRAEVCAATDVLGHGVNLPCETLLFAETTKFDGKERRDLEPWEIAQIAGRAGRYGFHERGHVGVLTGLPWADPEPDLVRAALAPHVPIEDGHLGYRVVDSGRLRPQLSDLNVTRVDELEPALHAWRHAALRYWSVDGWLEVESIQPLLARLDAVRDALHHARRTLALADVWKLVQAPVDEDNAPLLGTLAAAVAGDKPQQTVIGWILDPHRLDAAGLEEAEVAARGLDPPLVRAPVSGRRRRHHRARCGARGGRGGPRRARAASRDRGSDDRPLPRLRRPDGAVGDALRPLFHGARLPQRPALAGGSRVTPRPTLRGMLERAQTRALPLLNKSADITPALNACCGACRTCVTTNALTVALAALSWLALKTRGLLGRRSS
jgi:ATP-dependent RNA helicase SUPV3L1/SUV3